MIDKDRGQIIVPNEEPGPGEGLGAWGILHDERGREKEREGKLEIPLEGMTTSSYRVLPTCQASV